MEQMAVLKSIDLFKGLDSLELVQVSKLVKHKRFDAGQQVLAEGEPGFALFAVKSGIFRAYIQGAKARKELATFVAGDSFGELALIDHAPRSASVDAEVSGELLEFDDKAFETLLKHSEELRLKLLRDLAAKLRRANDRLAQIL
jgi:CRP/FNR family cyclic AMP-dependent transcriptional regulator